MVHAIKKIKIRGRDCQRFLAKIMGADLVGEDLGLKVTNNYLMIIKGHPN